MHELENKLLTIYKLLSKDYGARGWWPAKTKEEIIIGAILVQNVSWKNTKKAIDNLRKNKLLKLSQIEKTSKKIIARNIIPTRFYNQKTLKLKNFTRFLYKYYDGKISKLFKEELLILRNKLLGINGIGEETADSILLYAGNKKIFVIDAYTRRILGRIGLSNKRWKYKDYQSFFMCNLPSDLALYNDFHAQIVHLGFLVCKTKPLCDQCPLNSICKKNIDN